MKKWLLTIVVAIGMIFATATETKAQSALTIQGGYSWTEGVAAIGYNYGLPSEKIDLALDFKVGLMATKMPGDGSSVIGPTFTINLGPKYYQYGYYIGVSYNTVGYRSQRDYGSGWTDDVVAGMTIISIGYKVGGEAMYLKGDIGYGFSPEGSGMSYGIVLGFNLFGN